MASKFGKFLLFSIAAGAAAYGAFSYLKKEQVITPVTDDDDADVFEDDLDGEPTKARSYVNLQFDKAKAEDLAKNAVKKAKETISDSVQKVGDFFSDDPVEKVVDFFDDTAKDAGDIVETVGEEVSDVVEEIFDDAKDVAEDVAEVVDDATDNQ